ncbi:MAG TPA: hypothetical protein EYP86_00275 [Candidatus Altiarchaeales archaeon]|nr:hypothetical protein [Candidatus Altiarchaeales archaeon]
MKVMITLGPTREPIDSVRFITNASSGKMGASLAEEALSRGHEVTIVAGPVNINLPDSARIYSIDTTDKMINTVLKELERGYDILISTAAISDYSPEFHYGKISSRKEELTIRLKQNPKLTEWVRRSYPDLFIVAFKAEYDISDKELINRGHSKLVNEDLNLVVANDIKKNKFGSDQTDAYIIKPNKDKIYINKCTKRKLSTRIWDIIEDMLNENQ